MIVKADPRRRSHDPRHEGVRVIGLAPALTVDAHPTHRARLRGEQAPPPYDGRGSCYVEFGEHRVGRVDVTFLTVPKPTGTFSEPSVALAAEKQAFGSTRVRRWFGRDWTPV